MTINPKTHAAEAEPYRLSIADLLKRVPFSRRFIMKEIAAGRLRTTMGGGKHLTTPAAVEAWLVSLEERSRQITPPTSLEGQACGVGTGRLGRA
jgi:hypothetical protein